MPVLPIKITYPISANLESLRRTAYPLRSLKEIKSVIRFLKVQ